MSSDQSKSNTTDEKKKDDSTSQNTNSNGPKTNPTGSKDPLPLEDAGAQTNQGQEMKLQGLDKHGK